MQKRGKGDEAYRLVVRATESMSARPRGFIIDWRPRAETLALIAQVRAVLNDLRELAVVRRVRQSHPDVFAE